MTEINGTHTLNETDKFFSYSKCLSLFNNLIPPPFPPIMNLITDLIKLYVVNLIGLNVT